MIFKLAVYLIFLSYIKLIIRFVLNRSGSSVVEFAILAPVFILMLFGMIAYAIYFGAAHSVQQMAADAARVSIAGLSNTERDTLVGDYLERNMRDHPLLNRTMMSYGIGDSPNDPSQYQVRVAYDARNLPIWNLYPPLPLPSAQIAFTSTIRKGGR